MSRTARVAILVAVLVGSGAGAATAAASPPVKLVRYLGVVVGVPRGWPVVDLARHPATCVRLDRHAVYLGRPSPEERCPAEAIGRTETLLLQPAAQASRAGDGPGATLRRGRVLVSATWGSRPGIIRRALRLRSLLPLASPTPPAAAAARVRPVARTSAVTTGLGFDACATPSEATMNAWGASPYRTVGIYLGGQNMACRQPNLTTSWVTDETAAGWHFIPTYVGLQAPGTSCGCGTIDPASAVSEGQSAAADAVAQAQAVGIGQGNPIYFDMEAYTTTTSNTRAALTFLSAWTTALHGAGYLSGVYSSGASGISDLVGSLGSSFTPPDDIWIAEWNGRQSTVSSYVPAADWPNHQRLHQYSGDTNATYGGITISIDGDYVDGAVAVAGSAAAILADGQFVQVDGTLDTYEIAGGAPLPVTSWTPFGGQRPTSSITPQQFAKLNPVPANGTFLVTTDGAVYRVAGGALFPITDWSPFGGPQPAVTIDPADVELAGAAGSHLNLAPAPGTVVQGLPSQNYWRFSAAGRSPSALTPSAVAVAVPDAAVGSYALVPCVVPALRRLSLARARAAIVRAHCAVGKIHLPRAVRRPHVLRVRRQTPGPGARHRGGYKVALTLG